MKKTLKIFSIITILLLIVFITTSCKNNDNPNPKPGGGDEENQHIDYVSKLKLDMSSATAKEKVTVRNYVDGDTTHFNISTSAIKEGILKARYLATNTPESTGKIEPYGKTASNFTKSKLMNASSIIVESNTSTWNKDSTSSGRYHVWVWYRNSDTEEYRNLNLEILQSGLAVASNTLGNIYGETCMAALNQAKREKLYIFSGEKDPNMYYGSAVELTLKELRCNIDKYNGIKVAFEGVVVKDSLNTVYVEEYDPENDIYYGMQVYYGYGLPGEGLDILSVGNRVRIVGSVQYYETGGTYQVSDLQYRMMKPDDPNNIQKISDGNSAAYQEISAKQFTEGKVRVSIDDDQDKEFDLAYLIMNSSVSMKSLKVKSIYTTTNEGSSSNGAMTLTCEVDGITVSVRTLVLTDEKGNKITASAYEGKTISVKGLVDYYDGKYQIKVFSANDIEIM